MSVVVRNAWAISPWGDGVEPRRTSDSELLYAAPHARVERIAPRPGQSGNPVLLVTPLAVPVSCWDLRPGQSLAAHLAGVDAGEDVYAGERGRPTYTIDYGTMGFADRRMGFEDWVTTILPEAVRAVSAAHEDRPVHLVGWSHGGTLSLLLAAYDPSLPIAAIVALGTPTDYALNPLYAPVFWADRAGLLGVLMLPSALIGGTTAPLTRFGYRWLAPVREITKPWTLASNLHDTELLARIAAVDRFIAAIPGYPARFFHQALSRIVARRELAGGVVHLGDVVVEMNRLRAPLLLIGSDTDLLANAASVEAGLRAYPAAPVEFYGVHGLSHLGLIASPSAPQLTWPAIDRHLAAHD